MTSHKLDEQVEDILQHVGIKGMKWGVRRGGGSGKSKAKPKGYGRRKFYNDKVTIENKLAKKTITKKQAESAIDKNRHKLNMNVSKSYQKSYKKNLSKGMNHYKARNKAQFRKDIKRSLTTRLVTTAVIGSVTMGGPMVRSVGTKVMTPQNIRAGKNLMKAAVGSPLRYVDGNAMKNVIN